MTYLRVFYYASIPVVIGAVLSNRMAARLSDVDPVHWATPVVLGLVVFIIYTVDRLLDVRKDSARQPSTPRHRFHRHYAHWLWRLVIGAAGGAFLLLFFLPSSVIKFGLVLAVCCAAYVGVVFRLPARHPALLFKEPLVALLYSAGVWGSVWVQRPTIRLVDVTEGLIFMGIAFQNLLLFAVMEQLDMRPTGSAVAPPPPELFSLATYWGLDYCDRILRWLTLAIIVTAFTLCFYTGDRFAQRSALMLAVMGLVQFGIQRYPAYFLKNERYRWLGDGVFWMPALVL